MKVIYFSQTFFSDCDFPLIRQLQKKKVQVYYFMPLPDYLKKQGLVNVKKMKERIGIFKASEYEELNIYKDYIDLNQIFFLNIPIHTRRIIQRIFWVYVFIKMLFINADIFHFTWQLSRFEKILYFLPCIKAMTVHDPISHSCITDPMEEKNRKLAFGKASKYILLSKGLVNQFSLKYNISLKNIFFSKMGEFDHLRYLREEKTSINQPYILFFGQITSSKGLEYLCKAMTEVHRNHPNVQLVIAGRGRIYFDYEPFKNLDYIILKNEYLELETISTLLKHALFTVLPYKDATQSGVVQTAFSCNSPLIVTNVGGLPESVKDGITGLVIPPKDVNSLENAINNLLDNSEVLQSFRENIDKIWRPQMDWSIIAEDYI